VRADDFTQARLEQRFEVESVSSPSGVTHLVFSRR
jgi:hypothetical protein